MSTEDRWFPETTWEGEPVTKVFFKAANQKTANLVSKMVEQYLQSLFFKNLEPDAKLPKTTDIIWLVDMSRKEYKRIGGWEATQLQKLEEIPYAKPSQLPLFMVQFRGTLSGAKFGI